MELRTLAERFRDQRVLVTGGLGFIGSNLARHLVEGGADVTVVDSLIPEYGGHLFNVAGLEGRLRVNISDVRDQYSLRYLVKGVDVLFNLAGQTSHMDSMENPETDLAINCTAQLSILDTCRKFNPDARIVFASTRQIYGRPESLPVTESHPLNPVDVNGIHKMAAEFYHRLYDQVHGLRSCVLRLTNTVGPRMRVRDARQTFVGLWIRQLLEDRPIDVWGGAQLRDFTFVDDVVEALLTVAPCDVGHGQVYNLGGDEVVSLADLAARLVRIHGRGTFTVREFPPERKAIDIGDYYSDFRRIRETFGWTPRTPLDVALERTVAFYREHLPRYVA